MSKTDDPRIAEETFGVLDPLSEPSDRQIGDLGFFTTMKETSIDRLGTERLVCVGARCVPSHHGGGLGSSRTRWTPFICTIGGLAKLLPSARNACMSGHEFGGRLGYQNRWLLAIRVEIRSGVRPFNIDDGLPAELAAFQSDRPSDPGSAVLVNGPGYAISVEEADWDFGDLLASLLGGGEQRRVVLSLVPDLVT